MAIFMDAERGRGVKSVGHLKKEGTGETPVPLVTVKFLINYFAHLICAVPEVD